MNSFTLPAYESMRLVDINRLTEFQHTCSERLAAHLHTLAFLLNFFDTPAIRDEFITIYSNYMADHNIVRRVTHPLFQPFSTNQEEEIRFTMSLTEQQLRDQLHIQNTQLQNNTLVITRRSHSDLTFIYICTAFVEHNMPQFGIITELWEPFNIELFENLGSHNDTINLGIGISQTPEILSRFGETDRIFESYRQHLVEETYRPNKQHKVKIDANKFIINDENKDDYTECKLCYGDEPLYVCTACKYPMCKECLKQILKTTGLCPSCRAKNLTVCVIQRDTMNKELIDDINFDYENTSAEKECKYTPEQINEELNDEIHGNKNRNEPGEIPLPDLVNDVHVSSDDEETDSDDDNDEDSDGEHVRPQFGMHINDRRPSRIIQRNNRTNARNRNRFNLSHHDDATALRDNGEFITHNAERNDIVFINANTGEQTNSNDIVTPERILRYAVHTMLGGQRRQPIRTTQRIYHGLVLNTSVFNISDDDEENA